MVGVEEGGGDVAIEAPAAAQATQPSEKQPSQAMKGTHPIPMRIAALHPAYFMRVDLLNAR
jgi:hypothetical protein